MSVSLPFKPNEDAATAPRGGTAAIRFRRVLELSSHAGTLPLPSFPTMRLAIDAIAPEGAAYCFSACLSCPCPSSLAETGNNTRSPVTATVPQPRHGAAG